MDDREALLRVAAMAVAVHRPLARLPGARWVEDDGLVAVRTGSAFSGFNVVLGSGGAPAAALARAVHTMQGDPWTWWVGDEADPRLAAAVGAGCSARPLEAMYVDLRAPAGPPGAAVDAVETVDVGEASALHTWSEVVGEAWSLPPATVAEIRRVYAALALGAAPAWRCVLARWRGSAVGGCAWVQVEEGAALFAAGTVPHARGYGVAQALGAAVLARARAAGCSFAAAHTEPGGTVVTARLGFRRVGRIHILVAPG